MLQNFPINSSSESNQGATQRHSRRHFLGRSLGGLAGWGTLAAWGDIVAPAGEMPGTIPLAPRAPHFPPRAKSVIFLFMLGGPSQLDLFDFKPKLQELDGESLPESFLSRMQFAQITEKRPQLLGTHAGFQRYGKSGAEISELIPHLATVADDLAIVKNMTADEVPHHPAEVLMHTGTRLFGRPSLGAWISYGLGTEGRDLPGHVVLLSGMRPRTKGSIYTSGFLSSVYQGVPLRDDGPPILNLAHPPGVDDARQARVIEAVRRLNGLRQQTTEDPETAARSAAYDLAERLQLSAPEMSNLGDETQQTLDMYGVQPSERSFARNCLLARRLVERGVRYVQVCHGDWDHHGALRTGLAAQCRATDQACAALVRDLKQRGLLDETLVVWGGEFGRTAVGQKNAVGVGRDHQISAFTMWLAGGGIRAGHTVGETDELGCFSTGDSIHVHDLHATMLHLLGLDHTRLTYRHQGRDFRLTDVYGRVVHEILA